MDGSPRALRRIATAPGELEMARAYVAGDMDLEGNLDTVLALSDDVPDLGMGPATWRTALVQWFALLRIKGSSCLP